MSLPTTKLLKKEEAAAQTMSFQFEKPSHFSYRAGQFADYTLLAPTETDAEGNTRGFSLASAPYEPFLMATTRLRDTAFKRVLKGLPIGADLEVDAPYGSFTLHNNIAKPAVFLTGGIGITPVRSIVLQSAHDRTHHKIFVFYSNTRPQNAAFLDELSDCAAANEEDITFIATMTDPAESSETWTGETGFIDKKMISRYLADLSTPIYYLSGPAGMVTAMRSLLVDAGVDDDNIRTEEFTGY